MRQTCETLGHGRHAVGEPQLILPADFVPLRLLVEAEQLHIELTRPIAIVGRHSDADLRLADPEISRRHCQFVFVDGQWRIHDLRSLNGIYVNQQRVVEAILYTGDLVDIGGVRLLVQAATALRDLNRLRLSVRVAPCER